MHTRRFFVSGLIFALGLVCWLRTSPLQAQPHIVFILADDMGYGDLRSYNPDSKIATPHLDQLAKAGIRFTDAHSGWATCIPSRYSLLTGRFAARRGGFNDRLGPLVEAGRATVASMLRQRGYRTAMVGKWHLGFERNGSPLSGEPHIKQFDYDRPLAGGPVDCGFDSYFGMHASLDIPPYFYIRDRQPTAPPTSRVAASTSVGGPQDWNRIQGVFWRKGQIAPDFRHAEVTPRFAAEACRVIESHQPTQPLFLYLALPSPHTPWMPDQQFVGKSGAGLYGDFMMTVDHVVGQVLTSLEKAGMSDNTLVIFSSDNGPVWYEKDTQRFGHNSNGPLRGIKASVWEGGHRVPFIARWPGKIKPATHSNHTIAFADVFATLAEATGTPHADPSSAEDSRSFLAVMQHPNREHPPRPPVLHTRDVIRAGKWKLIHTRGNRGFSADRKRKYPIALYDLENDLAESNNLAEQNPEIVTELKRKLAAMLDGEQR